MGKNKTCAPARFLRTLLLHPCPLLGYSPASIPGARPAGRFLTGSNEPTIRVPSILPSSSYFPAPARSIPHPLYQIRAAPFPIAILNLRGFGFRAGARLEIFLGPRSVTSVEFSNSTRILVLAKSPSVCFLFVLQAHASPDRQ
ncbi:hypothetical protein BS78_02G100200 [Paspalum vaginatum]|nr:hypothetical protein BS78_02G100200 [Paspalum vaginatum]